MAPSHNGIRYRSQLLCIHNTEVKIHHHKLQEESANTYTTLLHLILRNGNIKDILRWYSSFLPILYYLSRITPLVCREQLEEKLENKTALKLYTDGALGCFTLNLLQRSWTLQSDSPMK